MRWKVRPQDFIVRELLDYVSAADGDHFLHVLKKEKRDTHEALALVAQRADLNREDIAFAGLKDRQGRTEQFVTIRGQRVDFRDDGVEIRCVDRMHQPVTSKMSRGNEFRITLREVTGDELAAVERGVESLARSGVPNYFGDQRFGCLRHGQGFVMRDLVAGDFETALHRLIARPSPVAKGGDHDLKRIIATHWGDWSTCARIARGPIWRRLFGHLVANPRDYRGAIEQLPVRQRLIHAFAFQSWLWNRAVSRVVERIAGRGPDRLSIPSLSGDLAAWRALGDANVDRFLALETPLLGEDGPQGGAEFVAALRHVLREARVQADGIAMNRVTGMILRAEPRSMLVIPDGLELVSAERDGRGGHTVVLEFALPRGSYATILLHRLAATARPPRRSRPHRSGGPPASGAGRPRGRGGRPRDGDGPREREQRS